MASTTPVPDVAAVLAENHRRFLTFLARRVPTREIAEDILQGAFVRGLTRAPALATTESVMAWFYRVLRNAIVDHYRRAGAESRAMERYDAEIDDAVAPLDTELLDVLCGCVRSLVTTLSRSTPRPSRAWSLMGRRWQSSRRKRTSRRTTLACACTEHGEPSGRG